ncbi:MAG: endolytic transglycosylase MltG [Halioglobus sp.]
MILLGLALLGAIAVREVRQMWGTPLLIPEQGFTLTIAPGESLRSVAERMNAAGVLVHPRLLILYARWTGLDQQIKQGEYLLSHQITAEALLVLLQRGNVIQYQVTLPEGITLGRALDILAEQDKLKVVLSGPDDPQLLSLVKPQLHTEGLFFPDTYHYAKGDTDFSILRRANTAMMSVLQEEWLQRAEPLPYKNPYEALIMASIIERETGVPEERTQISGVFVRRLQLGMLLQTDPTVIYGLGADFNGNLQRTHLNEESNIYNTYQHSGLPPTPIALPGKAAIHAALHPDPGDALYFVAKGDGAHKFSSTLAQHNQAVKEFQIQRKKNYRSQPKQEIKDE